MCKTTAGRQEKVWACRDISNTFVSGLGGKRWTVVSGVIKTICPL